MFPKVKERSREDKKEVVQRKEEKISTPHIIKLGYHIYDIILYMGVLK